MIGSAQQRILAVVLAVLFPASAWAGAPAIPAPFTGTWSPNGACETAYSDGVSIDANEVMFGETGFFVDRVVPVNANEADISASQPPESATQSTLHLHLRLSDHGRVLTIGGASRSSIAYHRCGSQP